MGKILYISPEDIASLQNISSFANSSAITKWINPVDYHYILFATLYQSGTQYFQTYKEVMPSNIIEQSFWNNKIVEINSKEYIRSKERAKAIVEGKFKVNRNDVRGKYLDVVLETNLSNIFYSLETGIPFVSILPSLKRSLDLFEKGLDYELFIALRNLLDQITVENIPTITPKHSLLKNDIKIFEDITTSVHYRNYEKAIELIGKEQKLSSVKKEIASRSLGLFNRYGSYLNLTDTAFNFLKFSKKIVDSFVSIIPPFVGDFIISSTETIIKNKRTIAYYEIKEVNYDHILISRIEEIIKKEGPERFSSIIKDMKDGEG